MPVCQRAQTVHWAASLIPGHCRPTTAGWSQQCQRKGCWNGRKSEKIINPTGSSIFHYLGSLNCLRLCLTLTIIFNTFFYTFILKKKQVNMKMYVDLLCLTRGNCVINIWSVWGLVLGLTLRQRKHFTMFNLTFSWRYIYMVLNCCCWPSLWLACSFMPCSISSAMCLGKMDNSNSSYKQRTTTRC